MTTHEEAAAYPGARPPDRQRRVDSSGVAIAVHEWGDEGAPPLLLAHGGMDFARTFDVFAPLLADAGWRVVSWDHRGHGDSAHAALYSWEVDLRDALQVFDSVSGDAMPVVAHSKGGSLMLQLADALPHRVSTLVNIDGLPSRRSFPDVSDHQRTKLMEQEITGWLDHRRSLADKQRRPGTIDELAERRGRMNPRLDPAWLRYLVTAGAREDADGWRWKIDPTIRFGGFGPWRPEWSMMRLPDIGVPVLAVLGTEADPLGWGTPPDDVLSHLPPGGRLEVVEGAGHFIHIERPHDVAALVLEHVQ
ncbi:MAG TPA: alpha/beta hydrolase [Acidimicrobiales bacterium]|nr:alpha/beta hydrolase [Acidimicrobiales bacterium]